MLINGDSNHIPLEDNSIDLIVTDPPYGISFMGKDWDKALPDPKVWQECFRVLKEGKLAFIMCSPRQDVLARMIIDLEDAGFKTGYSSIYWTYASGFPKAANISKLIDKKNGAIREIIGKREYERTPYKADGDKGGHNPQPMDWGKQVNQSSNYITKPATEEAKKMEGAYVGFQPKPAVEVILVVSKGKTLTWLDDCRIPYQSEDDKAGWYSETGEIKRCAYGYDEGWTRPAHKNYITPPANQKGRFPANLLVSDDVLNVFVEDYSRYFDLDKWNESLLVRENCDKKDRFPFIITPKASKSERNEGCEDLPLKQKEGSRPNSPDSTGKFPEHDHRITGQNHHPTVKPIKLMSYLITLGSRENDLVLDPFVGSGTTYKTCLQLHRKCIGIEINKEYIEIAKARISPLLKQTKLVP